MTSQKIRAVSYERVSTEKQVERQSILAQADEMDERLRKDPAREFLRRYQDEAFSGHLALHERPQGRRLLEDAAQHLFDEVWVFRTDRLGRDDIDPLMVKRTLERYRVKLRSLYDDTDSQLSYAVKVAVAAEERRAIQIRTRAGMKAASRRGRYIGGPPPYGYAVEERDGHFYLIVDKEVVWGDWTAADVMRRVFTWTALERRSARSIAKELNNLGVPTSYRRLRRRMRRQTTRNVWTAGRVLQLVKNTVYKGKPTFGKRPNDKNFQAEEFYGNCPPLVSEELWSAAQEALAANRVIPKNTTYVALLRSVIKCGLCGLTYCTSQGRDQIRWYRCNGQLAERGGKDKRCKAKNLKSTLIEPVVWGDVERFLREPGDILDELAAERGQAQAQAVKVAERITLEAALADLETRRTNALDMREKGFISDAELVDRLARVKGERAMLEEKLAVLGDDEADEEPLDPDLIGEIRDRLAAGLSDAQRQEVARLLVRQITVYTTPLEDGKKEAKAVIEYRFPAPVVVPTLTGTRASQNYNLKRVVVL